MGSDGVKVSDGCCSVVGLGGVGLSVITKLEVGGNSPVLLLRSVEEDSGCVLDGVDVGVGDDVDSKVVAIVGVLMTVELWDASEDAKTLDVVAAIEVGSTPEELVWLPRDC